MAHQVPTTGTEAARSGSSERRSRWPARIDVGRVVKPHGVRGEVALDIWGEAGGSLRPGAELRIGRRSSELLSVRGAGDRVLARLDGVDSRDAAEELRGEVLSVASSELPMPEDGEVYLFELDGCLVVLEEGEPGQDVPAVPLGTVRQVIEDGGGLLLEVLGEADGPRGGEANAEEGRIYLIPYVAAYLRDLDLDRGVLRFRLPEGLLETCVSTS